MSRRDSLIRVVLADGAIALLIALFICLIIASLQFAGVTGMVAAIICFFLHGVS